VKPRIHISIDRPDGQRSEAEIEGANNTKTPTSLLDAGRSVAAFDVSESSDDLFPLPLGKEQRTAGKEEIRG
jgi:hypothetical protein